MKAIDLNKNSSLIIYEIDSISDEMPSFRDEIRRISASVNQYPGEYLDKWVALSKIVIFLNVDGNNVGFSMAGFVGGSRNVLYFPATMLGPDYQNQGYASKFWTLSIKELVKVNLFNFLKPLYVMFRTQNPKLYSILNKKLDVFPSINGKVLGRREKALILASAKVLWPKKDIDIEKMIINNAYTETPELIFKPDQISWSGVKPIDSFFEESLHLSKMGIGAFVVVAKIRMAVMLYFARVS